MPKEITQDTDGKIGALANQLTAIVQGDTLSGRVERFHSELALRYNAARTREEMDFWWGTIKLHDKIVRGV